jgi:hypothetical protein
MDKKQTAIDWLIEQMRKPYSDKYIMDILNQAKSMEKEQIMKTARQCHFEGLRQTAKTSEEYLKYGEQYYNETYG